MASNRPKVYWEASPFVAHINNEPGRAHICHAILQMARQGDLELYTSALTLIEVFKVPMTPSEEAAEREITRYFRNRWIRKQNLDWYVAVEVRNVERRFPHLDGRDAIHLGTAVYLEVERLHTYDGDLLKCDGQVPNLKISEPVPFGTIPMELQTT